MIQHPTASRHAAAARDVLESVISEVPELPATSNRPGLRARLERAQASLAILEAPVQNPHDYHAEFVRATTRLERLIDTLASSRCGAVGQQLADSLRGSLQSLLQVRQATIDELAQTQTTPSAPRTFSVSHGYPGVFLSHDPILLPVPHPEAVDDPTAPTLDVTSLLAQLRASDEDELDGFGEVQLEPEENPELITLRQPTPRRSNMDTPGVTGEIAQLKRLARDCLQGIGALGNLRIVEDGERWDAGCAKFEKRLLAKLDALMALGEPGPVSIHPLEEAVQHAKASRNDFFRSFARTFVLGCSSGEAAARAVTAALLRDDFDVLDAHVEALALASNPALENALGQVLRSADDPRYLEAVLVALERRSRNGMALGSTIAEVELLMRHADGRVRAAAARAFAAHPDEARAITQLLTVLDTDVEEPVQTNALETLAMFDVAEARRRLLESLNEELASPGTLSRASRRERTQLLAIMGNELDATLLSAMAERSPPEMLALGFHGYAQCMPSLVQALNNEAFAPAAAAALHRISGALTGDDRYRPIDDIQVWQEWLTEEMLALPAGRLRFGQTHELDAVADELYSFGVPGSLRKLLAQELAIAGGPRLDVHGWCAQQRQRLDASGLRMIDKG